MLRNKLLLDIFPSDRELIGDYDSGTNLILTTDKDFLTNNGRQKRPAANNVFASSGVDA
jgi:hypothetical protein